MTNANTPSQEEPRQGVFEGIRGAKSQDLDAVEEPKTETQTAAPEEPKGETEAREADELEELRKEVNRLRQYNAQKDRKLAELGPYAQFGMTVASDEKGKAVVQRYEKGQPLFDEDGQMNYSEEVTERTGLTEDKLQSILDQREAAKELTNELNSIAEENLRDYKSIKRSQKFRDFHAAARSLAWNGQIPLDDGTLQWQNEYAAKEYTAIKKAYDMYLADSPERREAIEKAKKLEAEERKKEKSSVPSSDGTTTSSQEEPEETSPEDDLVKRMLNVRGRGKSFASVGSKSR